MMRDLTAPVTPSDQKTLAKIGLTLGTLLVVVGIFGIWLQGPFYQTWEALANQDLALSFVLPAAVTSSGCLLLAPVLLCSPLTAKWTAERRTLTYIGFFLGVIALIVLAGRIAASGVEKTSY
jgi:hypothetical protein